MELAHNKRDARKVRKLAKLLGERKVDKNIDITRNNAGELMTSEEEVVNEWVKFVEEMFKGPELPVQPKVETKHDYYPPEGMILAHKLEEAVRCMCSHKASGGDEVIAEYYRASATARGYLLRLANQIWMGEELPNEWTRALSAPSTYTKEPEMTQLTTE